MSCYFEFLDSYFIAFPNDFIFEGRGTPSIIK